MGKWQPRRWNTLSKGTLVGISRTGTWCLDVLASSLGNSWFQHIASQLWHQGCGWTQVRILGWQIEKIRPRIVFQINQARDICCTWCQTLRSTERLLWSGGGPVKWHKESTGKNRIVIDYISLYLFFYIIYPVFSNVCHLYIWLSLVQGSPNGQGTQTPDRAMEI